MQFVNRMNAGLGKVRKVKAPLESGTKTHQHGSFQFGMELVGKTMRQENPQTGRTGIAVTVQCRGHSQGVQAQSPLHVLEHGAPGLMKEPGADGVVSQVLFLHKGLQTRYHLSYGKFKDCQTIHP